jgi:uncharacterized membrane protein
MTRTDLYSTTLPNLGKFRLRRLALFTGCIAVLFVITACEKEKPAKISFVQDIQPILQKHCMECHNPGGTGFLASGLDMSTHQSLLKGTKFGPVIKAGDSLSSTLIILVEGKADPSLKMPHGDRKSLSAAEIKTLRLWIDQGAMNN